MSAKLMLTEDNHSFYNYLEFKIITTSFYSLQKLNAYFFRQISRIQEL